MDINLMLVGRTGQGKSATGNSILGIKSYFAAKKSTKSVTKAVSIGQAKFGSSRITVVDTIGYADTDVKESNFKHDSYLLMKEQIEQALKDCHAGFHAIVYVIKSSSRITAEQAHAFACITSVLGKENFLKFGILLFKYGNDYKRHYANSIILKWCQNQPKLKPFLDQCNIRVILFENKNNVNSNTQRNDLFNIVKTIMSNNYNTSYTVSHFNEAVKDRRYFDVEGIKETVENNVEKVCEDIDLKLKNIQRNEAQYIEKNVSEIDAVLDECMRDTVEKDQHTGILQSSIQTLVLHKTKVEEVLKEARREINYIEEEEILKNAKREKE